MSGFECLSPRLQQAISTHLRWSSLRPVQDQSIAPMLEGFNLVVLAPTAGGKTEAAFLPCLDVLCQDPLPGVRLVYVSPLVALLNNQEYRIGNLAQMVGLSAFKWHGGVSRSDKRAFLNEPSEILLTTPESLEAMLIGRTVMVSDLFRNLRFMVVDEVHAFAGSDRGAHLSAVIERLAQLSQYDVQRIGLSATVRNPVDIGRWLKGSSKRPGKVLQAEGTRPERQAQIRAFTDQEIVQEVHLDELVQSVRNAKTLIFTESRSDAEDMARQILKRDAVEHVRTYHSAISTDARVEAEDLMSSPSVQSACIVCTSAMELGVDIGDLDDVIQWGVPSSVSSLLQRWGRTGRREGRIQKTTLFARDPWETLTALAQVSLAQEGWVEAVRPQRRAYHILFQQTINLVLQHSGLSVPDIWSRVKEVPSLLGVTQADFHELLAHLLSQDILSYPGNTLVLGDKGERLLGAKNFQALIVSFETPDEFTVVDLANQFEVGQLEERFVNQLRSAGNESTQAVFLLAGRAWQVQRIVDERAIVEVRRYSGGEPPKWKAAGMRLMEHTLAWRHRQLLLQEVLAPENINPVVVAFLDSLRAEYTPTLSSSTLPFIVQGNSLVLMTFAGTRINATLASLFRQAQAAGSVKFDPFEVELHHKDRLDIDSVFEQLRYFKAGEVSMSSDYKDPSFLLLRMSKYQPFLPERMAYQIVADHLIDLEETRGFLDWALEPSLEGHLRGTA